MTTVAIATPLAGGELIGGIALTLSVQTLYNYGFRAGIQNDKHRQILLNMLCFTCVCSSITSLGYNATETFWQANDAALLIVFTCIQYALVIMNHNSIVRFSNLFLNSNRFRTFIRYFCYFLYLLPIVTLVPVYLAFGESVPLSKRVNKSPFNTLYYKPENLALIIATELFATVTDFLLLYKVRATHAGAVYSGESANTSSRKSGKSSGTIFGISADMLMFYLTTWLFFLFDVVIKILIYLGYPVLFDSVISVCTICLRSRANLQYGLELKSIFKHTETDARRSALSGGGVVGSISSSNTNNKLGNKNGSTIPAITKGTTAADEEKV